MIFQLLELQIASTQNGLSKKSPKEAEVLDKIEQLQALSQKGLTQLHGGVKYTVLY